MNGTALIRYSAGAWLGMVRGQCLVALPADASEETAAIVWDLLAESPGVERLLGTILSGRLDLTGLPSFGLVSFRDGRLHAILRGPLTLSVRSADGADHTVQGTGVATWNERVIPDIAALRFTVDDDETHAETLPLLEGAVRLCAVEVDLPDDGAALDAQSAPERAETAVPPAAPELQTEPQPVDPARDEPQTETDAAADDESQTEPAASEPVDEPEAPPEEPTAAVLDDTEDADGTEQTAAAEPTADAEPEESGETAETAEAPVDPDDSPGDQEPPAADVEADHEHTVASPSAQDTDDAATRTGIPGPQELIDSVPWLAAARQATADPDDAATQVPEMLEMPADLGMTIHPEQDETIGPEETDPVDDADTVLSPGASSTVDPEPAAPAGTSDPDDADTVLSPGAAAGDPGAAVPPAPPAPPSAPGSGGAAEADEADHDGHTVMRSDLEDIAQAAPAPAPPAPAPPTTGPMVLARVCAQGHANPPTETECSVCGQTLDGEAAQVRRPSLGRMRMSTGEVIELDRPVVIGRQPQAHRVAPGTMPRMIQVRSPHGDISRNHCEVVLEGWHVQLRDLKATNGTVLIREGRPPRRLGQGEQIMLLDGDIADLGDGVSARFEGLR